MDLKISAQSTALYSTYWFIDQLGLLLDCGDGAASMLQNKGRKVKTIACSHADRDHLTGLFQFLQVNSTASGPLVLYPKDCGSFPAIRDFTEKFDPHVAGNTRWQGIEAGHVQEIKQGIYLEAYPNRHIPRSEQPGGRHKSFSYSVYREKQKLKPEFASLSGPEIGQLRKERPDSEVLDIVRTTVLTYSGDTPLESADYWKDPEILIHEATFLNNEDSTSRNQDSRHSTVPDVISMAAEMGGLKKLILGHFSRRYHEEEIQEVIREEAARAGLAIPVFAVLPGRFEQDILAGSPVWSP